MIRVNLTKVDHLQRVNFRSRKCLNRIRIVQITVVLTTVKFGPQTAIIRAFNNPVLQMIPIVTFAHRSDCVVSWFDSQSFEIETDRLVRFIRRKEI
jgi:hypothetical protein